MTKYFILFLLSVSTAISQVGIGTTTPNASLEIISSNPTAPASTDGLLIPKIDEYPITNPNAAQDGMMVFVTGNGSIAKGFYYWDHTSSSWINATGAKRINELSDGITDAFGTTIYLGTNSGVADNGSPNFNVGIGYESLLTNINGFNNTAIGAYSLNSNIDGGFNVGIGSGSLLSNTSGASNVSVGTNSLFSNTDGNLNVAMGRSSLVNNTTGNTNIAIGTGALAANEIGERNTAVGHQAGSLQNDLDNNIYIGYRAGRFEANSERLYIENSPSTIPLIYGEFDNDILGVNGSLGVGTQAPETPLHVYGSGAAGAQDIVATLNSNASNRPVLQFSETANSGLTEGMSLEYDGRGSGGANRLVMNGIGGSPLFEFRNGGSLTLTGGSLNVNHPSGAGTEGITLRNTVDADEWKIYQQWNSNTLALFFNGVNVGNFDDVSGVYTAVSDERRKQNIAKINPILEKVSKLNVVEYSFSNQKDTKKYIGLLAQEVEKEFPHLVVAPSEEQENYTMDYSGFGVLAIKAIQEQQKQIELLQKEIRELRSNSSQN